MSALGAFPAGEVELDPVDLDDPDELVIEPFRTPLPPSSSATTPARLDELAWRAAGRAHLDPACPVLRATHPDLLPPPRHLAPDDALALHQARRGECLPDRICSCALAATPPPAALELAGLTQLTGLLLTSPTPGAWERTVIRAAEASSPLAEELSILAEELRSLLLAQADPRLLLRRAAAAALSLELPEPYATSLALHDAALARLTHSWPPSALTRFLDSWTAAVLADPDASFTAASSQALREAEVSTAHEDHLLTLPTLALLLQRSCEDLVTLATAAPPAVVVIHDLPTALDAAPTLAQLCTTFELHPLARPHPHASSDASPAALILPALVAETELAGLSPEDHTSFGGLDAGCAEPRAVIELAWALRCDELESSASPPEPSLALRAAQDALAL